MKLFPCLICFLFTLTVSSQLAPQFTDFPAGYDSVPKDKLKGPVHIVLTIEQQVGDVLNTVVEVYDLKGRLTESLSSSANTPLARDGGKEIYLYDWKGILFRLNEFDPEGKFWGYRTYKYDSGNHLIESTLFNKKDEEIGKTSYVYTPEKREVDISWTRHDVGAKGSTIRSLLSYDDKGRWISRKQFDGSADFLTFDYDQAGNFVKSTTKGQTYFWILYSYKFDKFGNWIERDDIYYQLGKEGKEEARPDSMNTYRMITYYQERAQ